MKKLIKSIKEHEVGRILYFDGGMGTMLQNLGLPFGVPPEVWNI